MIIVILVTVIGSLILGLGRKLSGDILHLISAAAAFLLALFMPEKATKLIAEVISGILPDVIAQNGCLTQMTLQFSKPLTFSVAFAVCFIVIGLITHVISNLLPEKKKPNIAVKMVLNLLAGLLVGYALLVPAAYYPAKAEKLIDVADDLGISVNINAENIARYKVNEKLYSFILNGLDKFEFEGIELSVDKAIDDLEKLSAVSNLLNNTSRWSDIADKINSDEISDAFFCLLLSDRSSKNEVIKGISEADMMMREKVDGTKAVINAMKIFTSVNSNVDDLKQFISALNPEICQSTAKIFDRVRLDAVDINIGRNAPLIASIFRSLGTMSDRSEENLAKEAEALSYFLIPQNAVTSVFDFERLDPIRALDYIMNSEVIRNSLIKVTGSGEIFNPCRIKNRISPAILKSLFTMIQTSYGVSTDDALYKSLEAYFAIENQR